MVLATSSSSARPASSSSASMVDLMRPTDATGLVSVIPQAWPTRMPIFISRSTIVLGAAEPPMVTMRRCFGSSPVASICWNIDSQTVGTPAEWVTFSSFISRHRTIGSLTWA